jgi:hypothetical protein
MGEDDRRGGNGGKLEKEKFRMGRGNKWKEEICRTNGVRGRRKWDKWE